MGKHFHLPPISALRAIEATARLGSFTRAAEALNVTQGAVSHAIKGVEEALGRRLFLRRHQEIIATRAALDLAAAIRDSLGRIEDAFARAVDVGARLTVKVQPTVAMRWLMPRLAFFKRAHPDIDLRVTIGWDAVDFSTERFDAGIVWDAEPAEGVVITPLFQSDLIAVAAPSYLRERTRGGEPNRADRIIHNEPTGRAWASWLQSAGLPPISASAAMITTDTDDAAIRLASAGQGVTLATTRFVEDDLAANTLAIVGSGHKSPNGAYYLVGLAERSEEPAFLAFRSWLIEMAERQGPVGLPGA
jgi:LysR family transcriptional regulator, glycine cleavage system transcriptional activator